MSYLTLFIGEWKFALIRQRRYLMNLVASLINILLFLVFIQLGMHALINGTNTNILENKTSTLIMGFFSFMMITSSISVIASDIMDGSTTGTLEQIMISPLGSEIVLLAKAFASSSINLITATLMIPDSMAICSHWFTLDLLSLALVIPSIWICGWGLSFILGGCALIFKKIHGIMNLLQFFVLTLLIVPAYPFNTYSLLPMSSQATTISTLIALNKSFSLEWLGYLYFNSIIYFILGLLVFRLSLEHAMKKGIVGQY